MVVCQPFARLSREPALTGAFFPVTTLGVAGSFASLDDGGLAFAAPFAWVFGGRLTIALGKRGFVLGIRGGRSSAGSMLSVGWSSCKVGSSEFTTRPSQPCCPGSPEGVRVDSLLCFRLAIASDIGIGIGMTSADLESAHFAPQTGCARSGKPKRIQ